MRVFSKPGLYKHISCLDVDFYVTKVTYRGPTYIKAKVLYVCKRTRGLYNKATETVKIKREDFWKWEIVNE